MGTIVKLNIYYLAGPSQHDERMGDNFKSPHTVKDTKR